MADSIPLEEPPHFRGRRRADYITYGEGDLGHCRCRRGRRQLRGRQSLLELAHIAQRRVVRSSRVVVQFHSLPRRDSRSQVFRARAGFTAVCRCSLLSRQNRLRGGELFC